MPGVEKEGWPREKLFQHGSHVLGNEELLALVLGTGSRNRTSTEVARRLVQSAPSLRDLAAWGPRDFSRIEGIGPGKG
ncbi:MAG: hypothetical protein O3C45_07215, partial [Bacteroidetes bacterium]|nr:hypothetical protein [Bacteroidota bacterium]